MSCCGDILVLVAGCDEVFSLVLKNDDDTPTDLTGASILCDISQDGTDTIVSTVEQDTHDDAEAGLTTLTIPRADTGDMVPGVAYTAALRIHTAGNLIQPLGVYPVRVESMVVLSA